VRGHVSGQKLLGVALACERRYPVRGGGHVLERPGVVAPRLVVGERGIDASGSSRDIGLEERDQTIGRSIGRGFKSTEYTTLKMAVFAPMPSAIAMTASRVGPGALRKARQAK